MEKTFGCFYNPRPAPGRCIKDVRSSDVDSKCSIHNNRCVLESDAPKESILVPTRTEAAKAKLENEASNIISGGETNAKISGPISANVGEKDGVKYILFGDVHFSLHEKTCKEECKDIINVNSNMMMLSNPGNSNCWYVTRLIHDIIEKHKNKYVDVYLEFPFIPKDGYFPTKGEIESVVGKLGWIYKVFYDFYGCFRKDNCRYKNARFHYVDPRLRFAHSKQNITGQGGMNVESTSIDSEISDYIEISINMLAENIFNNVRSKINVIEWLDQAMKMFYTGGTTMTGRIPSLSENLFKLHLTSDNFIEDSLVEINKHLSRNDNRLIRELIKKFIDTSMLVERRGKTMHRVRAQLEALEMEGKSELARKIVSFSMRKYNEFANKDVILGLWGRIMKVYKNFINPKTREFGDEFKTLSEIQKEYEKSFGGLATAEVTSTALLMDVYLLARMFRTFPNTNHTNSSIRIIYAGDAHIDTYNEFLSSALGVKMYKYGDPRSLKNYKRCVDVDINKFL